jgi:hypothetical protein
MKKLVVQSVHLTKGIKGIKAKQIGSESTEEEIDIDDVVSMLFGHGIDSPQMRELIAAYQLEHNKVAHDMTWVVREIQDFIDQGSELYCEIQLQCGYIDEDVLPAGAYIACKECGQLFEKQGKRVFHTEKCRSRFHARKSRRKKRSMVVTT